ncbi:hypothetical protein [Flavobacterium subsaxonicum]|uniref:Transcriptional regulator n=1 Tax=Flavobacterium subsaxonicum WB 4.1-42 = DSM 21790 TaxID=1121898 RepID=A0A0A2MU87_9FLAO|nr:hypothetical protein [Flavobacterium subsaxonicum]KGO95043.1 hypothetical protein Q766_02740 [Flavobacterium subsaxonicum WB 4.1-42 = DSM 21790]
MDIQKPLSDFFAAIKNDYRVSSTHIGIFAALLHYKMDRGFTNPIQAFSYEIMELAKISAPKTYRKCLKDLDAYGYLRYEPSFKKNQASKIYISDTQI